MKIQPLSEEIDEIEIESCSSECSQQHWYDWGGLQASIRYLLTEAGIPVKINFTAVSFTCSIFTLLGPDIQIVCFNRNSDVVFDVLLTMCFVFFLVEMLLSVFANSEIDLRNYRKTKGYVCSIFFFLDVVALASILPDISYTNLSAPSSGYFHVGRRVFRMIRLIR